MTWKTQDVKGVRGQRTTLPSQDYGEIQRIDFPETAPRNNGWTGNITILNKTGESNTYRILVNGDVIDNKSISGGQTGTFTYNGSGSGEFNIVLQTWVSDEPPPEPDDGFPWKKLGAGVGIVTIAREVI